MLLWRFQASQDIERFPFQSSGHLVEGCLDGHQQCKLHTQHTAVRTQQEQQCLCLKCIGITPTSSDYTLPNRIRTIIPKSTAGAKCAQQFEIINDNDWICPHSIGNRYLQASCKKLVRGLLLTSFLFKKPVRGLHLTSLLLKKPVRGLLLTSLLFKKLVRGLLLCKPLM